MTKEDSVVMAFLFTTINEVTGGIRKSTWFFSKNFLDLFNENFQSYSSLLQTPHLGIGTKHSAIIQPTFANFNLLSNLNELNSMIHSRFQSLSYLDQKFAKMFLTSSLQQRVFAN